MKWRIFLFCELVKMAMQLRVYDTFRLKVEQRSDGPESDNIAQTRDTRFLTGTYEAYLSISSYSCLGNYSFLEVGVRQLF